MKKIRLALRYMLQKVITLIYLRQYWRQLKINKIRNVPAPNEKEWKKKWSVLGNANPIYYRLFSHYIGNDINIIPEDICRNIVEPILDPLRYVSYYADKNIFDKLYGKKIVLNKSLLKPKDVTDFEHESSSQIAFNMPPINDRDPETEVLQEFIDKLEL